MARELYERYPDFSEGRLAKIRSHVVSRASCAVVSRQLELGKELAERGADIPADELGRLSRNRNVLAALLEAALAASFSSTDSRRSAADRPGVAGRSTRGEKARGLQTELGGAARGQVGELTRARGEGTPHDRRFTHCGSRRPAGVGSGEIEKTASRRLPRKLWRSSRRGICRVNSRRTEGGSSWPSVVPCGVTVRGRRDELVANVERRYTDHPYCGRDREKSWKWRRI